MDNIGTRLGIIGRPIIWFLIHFALIQIVSNIIIIASIVFLEIIVYLLDLQDIAPLDLSNQTSLARAPEHRSGFSSGPAWAM